MSKPRCGSQADHSFGDVTYPGVDAKGFSVRMWRYCIRCFKREKVEDVGSGSPCTPRLEQGEGRGEEGVVVPERLTRKEMREARKRRPNTWTEIESHNRKVGCDDQLTLDDEAGCDCGGCVV